MTSCLMGKETSAWAVLGPVKGRMNASEMFDDSKEGQDQTPVYDDTM